MATKRPIAVMRDVGDCLAQVARGMAFRNAAMDDTKGNVPLMQALLDAIDLFEQLGIDYALVGGLAAMVYGRARFTEDVDLVAVRGPAGSPRSDAHAWF